MATWSTTTVKNGKVIKSSKPGVKVGSTFQEKPDPTSTPGHGSPTDRVPITPVAPAVGNTPIDTTQPNPATAQVTPPNSNITNFDAKTGQPLAPGASTTDVLGNVSKQGNPFVQAHTQTVATGADPNAAGAQGVATKAVANNTLPPVSPLGDVMETDTNFDSIFTNLDKYMEPLNQKTTLLQEYKSMEKSLGINAMNEELIDAKRIIEGTEDDIRSEVQAASGFATDSQVLALANARNKSLVKNYNVLLESRDNAMTQLSTMMNLTIEDRKAAENEFDRKMNFAFKVAEFKDKAISNAREGYKNTLTLMGADGMYNALLATGDPSAMALVEKTLGVPVGGLKLAAEQAVKTRATTDTKDKLSLDVMRANIKQSNASADASTASAAKTRSEMGSGSKVNAKVLKGVTTAETVLSKVADATKKVTGGTTGFLGKISSKIAGTSAYELARTVDTIQANIGFDTLQAMRDSSPTGGALGAISEREISLLQSTVASLDVGQSADLLKTNLKEVASHYENWLHTVGYTVAPDGTVVQITDAK